ncbi:MAG TPA: glycosyltransferase [Candidatus Eisenbacteria bacterium]
MNVAHLDSGRSWRGGQAQVLLLLRGLAARGHRSLLLAPHGPLLERAAAEDIACRAWAPRGEWDLAALAGAAGHLRRFAPEVAHAHSAHAHALGVPAARLAGVPAVVVSRRVDFAVATHPLSRLKYRMPVDRYLCISRGVRDVMRAGGVPERRLALVPSGIELPDGPAPPPEPPLRALLGVADSSPVVGTVAALAPHKNHADLMRAARQIVDRRPDVHFAWLGEGECRAALERQRAELGLEAHVHLLGFRSDARARMREFTLFALSSYLEGLCTSVLDAQALGVPVVATAVGGVPDAVEDGVTGRLVAPRDPGALAGAILDALADEPARRAWAVRARESVRAFSADRMVEQTLAAYAAALADHGVPA